MLAFIVYRLAQTGIVLLLVSFIAFSLIHFIPGDPALAMLGADAAEEQVEALREELWLDRPFIVQYAHWFNNVLHGDFGKSIVYSENVTSVMYRTWPITAYLSGIAMVFSAFIGIPIGIISAVRRATFLDNVLVLFANLGIAIPIFWLGLLLIYIAGYKLGWLPIQGFTWPTENLGKSIGQSIMPVITLGVPIIAMIARQVRASMLEVIQQDYIRTAKAKGLKERGVILKHALKNSLIPVVTLMGILVRVLIGSSVLVETVFNIPGLGRLLVTASFQKDFILLQAGVLLISVIVCFATLAVDISYGWLDPRMRTD